jgi:hypothetical protein
MRGEGVAPPPFGVILYALRKNIKESEKMTKLKLGEVKLTALATCAG